MLFRTDFISPATAFERSRPRRTLRTISLLSEKAHPVKHWRLSGIT
jgi:hypothetical protein